MKNRVKSENSKELLNREFYDDSEGSFPKALRSLIVGRNPQRPKVEESATNKTLVGKMFPKRPIPIVNR